MLLRPSTQHTRRHVNRILVLCSSINDVTAWPFWKFLQMKRLKGVTDMAFLAFSSHGGSFEAGIQGEQYTLKNYARVRGYKRDMLEEFVHRWHDPGRSYFVYGGHGMGDYVELEQDKVVLQAHELARMFGKRRFEAIVFDACFMANLDCVYHLRHNTRYIGACEGYMWEPDTELDLHVLNAHNASVMSRCRDARHILDSIQRDYCTRCPRGDFAVLDTTHVAQLYDYVQRYVMQRVYDRATLYSTAQQQQLRLLAAQELQRVHERYGKRLAGVDGASTLFATRDDRHMLCSNNNGGSSDVALTTPHVLHAKDALSSLTLLSPHRPARMTRRQRVEQAIQFEHALYPSEVRDKHLVDLHSYLVDMAVEEAAAANAASAATTTTATSHRSDAASSRGRQRRHDHESNSNNNNNNNSTRDTSRVTVTAWPHRSRALCVEQHGTLPARVHIPCSPALPVDAHDEGHATDKDTCAKRMNEAQCARTRADAIATPSPSSSSSSSSSLSEPVSPFAPHSAHTGLDLFHKVVLRHCPSRTAELYAARLGGLSLTVHEYSALSRPLAAAVASRSPQQPPSSSSLLSPATTTSSSATATSSSPSSLTPSPPSSPPYTLDRRALAHKTRLFLRHGRLDEVHMRASPPATNTTTATATTQMQRTDVRMRDTTTTTAATASEAVTAASTAAASSTATVCASATATKTTRRVRATADTAVATTTTTTNSRSIDAVTRHVHARAHTATANTTTRSPTAAATTTTPAVAAKARGSSVHVV